MAEQTSKKGDFIELEFLGRNLGNNEVFDTNMTEEAKKIDLKLSGKPLIICIGKSMVVPGFDESLESKEVGKKYTIKLSPEKGFGKRHSNLIRTMPLKIFAQQKVYPQPGMTFALDNNLVKVISVTGGRVMVDFNNPLAGKDLEYEFTIKRLVTDKRERVSAVQLFFFGHEFEFDIDEKTNKIIFKDLKLVPVLNAFKSKFKELLGMEVEILEKKEDKKEEKKEETKKSEEKTDKKEPKKEEKK
jgi:FKBP-type peptidyl-prolyl cis-trans isomerase 2